MSVVTCVISGVTKEELKNVLTGLKFNAIQMREKLDNLLKTNTKLNTHVEMCRKYMKVYEDNHSKVGESVVIAFKQKAIALSELTLRYKDYIDTMRDAYKYFVDKYAHAVDVYDNFNYFYTLECNIVDFDNDIESIMGNISKNRDEEYKNSVMKKLNYTNENNREVLIIDDLDVGKMSKLTVMLLKSISNNYKEEAIKNDQA